MLFRNLASMDVEEAIRANPLDGVVLLAGCDKTTPATLMGACSVDLPTLMVSGGPMLNGRFRGQRIGSGTHVWKFSEAVKAGEMSNEQFMQAESCMSRSAGHCMSMGTASTMACMVEALGIAMPGNAAIPAVDSRRYELAQRAGRQIVELVNRDVRPSAILTRQAFENAIRVCGAIGGRSASRAPEVRWLKFAGISRPASRYARRIASTFGLKIVLRLSFAQSFELRGISRVPWNRGIT